MHVRMKRRHEYDVPERPGVRRALPAGWAGELPDDIGAAAVEAGAAIASDTPAPAKKAKKPAKAPKPDVLLGSSTLPAEVEIAGYKVQLGGVVAGAHKAFAASLATDVDAVKGWNDLEAADREGRLLAFIQELEGDPDRVPASIDEASILAKPQTS